MRIIILTGVLALSGCGVVFPYESSGSCPQMAHGVCASVRQVYDATNGRDHVDAGGDADPQVGPAGDAAPAAPPRPGGRAVPAAVADAGVPGSGAAPASVLPLALAGDGVLPLRSPPEIMRIWIAPWESDAGDLMMSGYVFTELQPRRWQLGPEAVPGTMRLRPVDPSSPPSPAPPPAAAPGGAAGVVTVSRTGAGAASGTAVAPGVEAARPVARVSAPAPQPRGPEGSFWQTEPGAPAVQ